MRRGSAEPAGGSEMREQESLHSLVRRGGRSPLSCVNRRRLTPASAACQSATRPPSSIIHAGCRRGALCLFQSCAILTMGSRTVRPDDRSLVVQSSAAVQFDPSRRRDVVDAGFIARRQPKNNGLATNFHETLASRLRRRFRFEAAH